MSDRKEKESQFQPEHDAAVRELARRTRAFCDPAFVGDHEHFAEAFVAWLRDNHWRAFPPPPDWRTGHGRPGADPNDNEEWREAAAKIRGDRT